VVKFLADHNLHQAIVRGLKRRKPDLDIVLVRDVGLAEAEDSEVLEWAATEGRILLTHDRQTMTRYANERVRSGPRMPGLFVMDMSPDIGGAIDDILTIVEVTEASEWHGKTEYLLYRD
jgi:hypothetical protein